MAVYKTVPNQKVVKVQKEKCDRQNLYATINLEAMEQAAQSLDAGAFKLWCYFAKNQNDYEFALSSKEVLDTFGIKSKQYNNAVDELIEKGYLVAQGGNKYTFNEIAVISKGNNEQQLLESLIPKGNNAVMPKSNNDVIPKGNNALLPKDIRNNTNTTQNKTIDNTLEKAFQPTAEKAFSVAAQDRERKAQVLTSKEAIARYGLGACANRVKAGLPGCYWINGELIKLV